MKITKLSIAGACAITLAIGIGVDTASATPFSHHHMADGQFDFSIKVKTSPWVTYGVKTPYVFSTASKMSGSCSIYRWEQDSAWTRTRIGSATLKKGSGKGSVTWEWDSQSANPVMNLEVYCKVGNLYGAGYQVVTGEWGHD
jgi:hypothetical protein